LKNNFGIPNYQVNWQFYYGDARFAIWNMTRIKRNKLQKSKYCEKIMLISVIYKKEANFICYIFAPKLFLCV